MCVFLDNFQIWLNNRGRIRIWNSVSKNCFYIQTSTWAHVLSIKKKVLDREKRNFSRSCDWIFEDTVFIEMPLFPFWSSWDRFFLDVRMGLTFPLNCTLAARKSCKPVLRNTVLRNKDSTHNVYNRLVVWAHFIEQCRIYGSGWLYDRTKFCSIFTSFTWTDLWHFDIDCTQLHSEPQFLGPGTVDCRYVVKLHTNNY